MKKVKRSVLECGQTILNGRYEILKVIHTTGMANIYMVSDSNLNKYWCLKEIKKSEAGKNEIEYYSLIHEANIMKSLSHSGIPRIVTIEQEGDSIFIVMDYVDGMSIKSWIQRKGRVKQDVAVIWMKQICQIMIYLHNRKNPIFYRDMKPDNVMIQSDGNIKLLDFGISIVIKEPNQKIDRALGTKGYAAPEQSKRGNVCDLRSDIYAMGKTLYYMLTGLNPSQLKPDQLKSVRDIDSSISVGLENIVNKCIQPNPDDRYQSCEELLYALQNYVYLDTKYRSKIRRKVYVVFGMFITSIFLIVTSLIPYNIYNNQQIEQYNKLLAVAEQSGRQEDFEAVLNWSPLNLAPYNDFIESMKVDGVFSKDEESVLLGYVNPNLEEIKQQEGYGELAYEIGKLYWFYYDGSTEDEGMIISTKWFSDAMEAGYEVELAQVYYQLGSFKRNISASVTESSDAGMYSEYFNNLITAKKQDNGELVNLQLNLALANCISTYTYNLMTDGISYADIKTQITMLNEFVNSYVPTIEKAQKSFDSLSKTVSTLQDKVDSVYKGGAN